jgi:GDP-L-fucose synthase
VSRFWRGRPVLVTGGSGFIGSHLVELLVESGARVTATASSEATKGRFLDSLKGEISFSVGDLRDADHARRAVRGHDVVMHLAARVGGIAYNIAHPGSIFRENLQTFMCVLEAARQEGVGRFLVTSSACVYPRFCSIPTPEAEGFVGRPEETNEGYGWAKRMEEFLGEAYAREYGMEIRIARPYNAYGPRDNFDPATSHVIPALIRRVFSGEDPMVVWGDGTATRSFLYVGDFARGLMAVVEHSPRVEAVNIGADEEVSVRDLAELIVKLSGRSVKLEFDASKPGGQPRRRCDTALAERLLGFRARVPLAEGLRRTIDWYRASRPA